MPPRRQSLSLAMYVMTILTILVQSRSFVNGLRARSRSNQASDLKSFKTAMTSAGVNSGRNEYRNPFQKLRF